MRSPVAALFFLALQGGGFASDVPADSDLSAHYRALGLAPTATQLDVHLAYVGITSNYRPGTRRGTDARRQFVEAQQAFQALSDPESRQEALGAVKYWDHIERLHDDEHLQHFTEFQPGGSAHLRVVFLLETSDEQHWGVFATATSMNGNIRVAQMGHRSARGPGGEQGSFLASLKVRQYPAAVIYDPISRAMKISYGLEGVDQEAQRFLYGEFSPTDKLARVQELDSESLRWRCGGGKEGSTPRCDWAFVLATTASLEKKKDELMGVFRNFADACKMLHNVRDELSKEVTCFWLRLERAEAWGPALRKGGMLALDEYLATAVSFEPPAIKGASTHISRSSPLQLQGWFRKTITETEVQASGESLPVLPLPLNPDEEPVEPLEQRAMRKARQVLSSVVPGLDAMIVKAKQEFKNMDMEEKTMVAGAALCAVLLLAFVLKQCCCCCCCCCRRGSPPASSLEVLRRLAPVIAVPLRRQEGEKLGLGISNTAQDSFVVTGVATGELVDRWNAAQPDAHARVREGDQIVAVTPASSGSRLRSCGPMSEALKAGGDMTLSIAMPRNDPDPPLMQQAAGIVCLNGLGALQDLAEFRMPELSWSGVVEKTAVEIASVGSQLAEWNAKQRSFGACCLQSLEVGDRVVSLNNSTDVHGQFKAPAQEVLICRWRPVGSFQADEFEVRLQRTGPEDRLGMNVKNIPGSEHIEVIDIVAGCAISRRNEANEGRCVLAGDRIVSVNGKTTFQAMHQELGSLEISITFARWAGGAGAGDQSRMFGHVPLPTPAPAAPRPPMPSKPSPAAVEAKRKAAAAQTGPVAEGLAPLLYLVALALLVAGLGTGLVPQVNASQLVLGSAPGQDVYASAGLAAVAVGGVLAVWFVWCELSMLRDPAKRRTLPQLLVATASSISLGYGNFFLLKWAAVYS